MDFLDRPPLSCINSPALKQHNRHCLDIRQWPVRQGLIFYQEIFVKHLPLRIFSRRQRYPAPSIIYPAHAALNIGGSSGRQPQQPPASTRNPFIGPHHSAFLCVHLFRFNIFTAAGLILLTNTRPAQSAMPGGFAPLCSMLVTGFKDALSIFFNLLALPFCCHLRSAVPLI